MSACRIELDREFTLATTKGEFFHSLWRVETKVSVSWGYLRAG